MGSQDRSTIDAERLGVATLRCDSSWAGLDCDPQKEFRLDQGERFVPGVRGGHRVSEALVMSPWSSWVGLVSGAAEPGAQENWFYAGIGAGGTIVVRVTG